MSIESQLMRGRRSDEEPSTVRPPPPPPDGGWGWVVVFASFMIHVVADGITYTFGIFFVQFVQYYDEGSAATSFIASILVGTTLCCGPVASALTNKYGCRAVTIVGAVIATIGFVISIWAPNVTTLYFTIGLCVGIGFGLIYLPAIVSVTCYFERYRAFATGIAVCGSGLGTFILAPLIEYLTVHVYGWKGAMIIVAGLCLNCAVFGALFRSPDEGHRRCQRKKNVRCALVDMEEQRKFIQEAEIESKSCRLAQDHEPPLLPTGAAGGGGLRRSVTVQGELVGEGSDLDADNNHIGKQDKALIVWSTLNLVIGGDKVYSRGKGGRLNGGSALLLSKGPANRLARNVVSGPLYRKDIFYGGSLYNIEQYRSNPSLYSASVMHIPPFNPASANMPPVQDMPHPLTRSTGGGGDGDGGGFVPCRRWWTSSPLRNCLAKEMKDAFAQMTDLSLLKDHVFLLFAVSNFLTSIGFNVPYVYIKDRALLLGVSGDDSSFLLGIIGVSNTVSRVVLGYVSDKTWFDRLWLYCGSLSICGIATATSSLCTDYPSLVVYAVIFGITAGAYVGLTSVILVDLLGLEKLTNAFGLLLLFQGFASMIGPPIAGWLFDMMQSYDPGFYVAGGTIAVSGLMLLTIPCVQAATADGGSGSGGSNDEDGSPPITIESGLGSEDGNAEGDDKDDVDVDDDDDMESEDRPMEIKILRASSPPLGIV